MVFNSLKKFHVYNETDVDLKKELKCVKEVLKHAIKFEKVTNIYFSVIIVDNKTIRDINKNYRNIDKETDVISFALNDEKDENFYDVNMLGDIYISIDKALEQANAYGHSLIRELSFLAVHGFLHLLGYDHMKDEDEKIMFEKQELILDEKRFTSLQGK